MHIDGAFEDDRTIAYGGLHQLPPGERPTRLGEHTQKKTKFCWGEIHFLVFKESPVTNPVDADGPALKGG